MIIWTCTFIWTLRVSEISFVPGNYSLSYEDAKVQPQQLSERFSYKREDTNEYRNGKEFDSFSGITFQKLFNAKENKMWIWA